MVVVDQRTVILLLQVYLDTGCGVDLEAEFVLFGVGKDVAARDVAVRSVVLAATEQTRLVIIQVVVRVGLRDVAALAYFLILAAQGSDVPIRSTHFARLLHLLQ